MGNERRRFRRGLMALVGALTIATWSLAPAAGASAPQVTDPAGAPVDSMLGAPVDSTAGAQADSPVQAAAPVDRTSRAAVIAAYRQTYLAALNTPIGWTGNTANCQAGTISSAAQHATSRMVNYFRSMVDLPAVTFDPALSAKAQQAALMMSANQSLSHFPPTSWRCWSAAGAEAAGSSNLALGVGGAGAVDLQVFDPGSTNTAVGHRRWIMFPPTVTMGSGSTSNANSLWVFGARGERPHTRPVEWPSAGFFPRELEPGGRWSVSVPGADLDAATVRITGPSGAVLPVTVHRPVYGYGDPTLVWELGNLGEVAGRGDRTYRVDVSGIADAASSTHSYRVTLVDAAPPVPYAPVGTLDEVSASGRVVTIRGWAADRNLMAGGLHVRVSTAGWSSTLRATRPRPDLRPYGLPTTAGFETKVTLSKGTHRICAQALNHTGEQQTTTPTPIGCKDVVVK